MTRSGPTPARKQYLQIKAQYPDTIVFFRLGDFYEFCDDDAKIAAQVCDIVLTSRPVGRGEREVERRLHVGRGNVLHALEGFQAALDLSCLGRFGPETVHELLDFPDLPLLFLQHRLLRCELLCPLFLEGRVIPGINLQLTGREVQRMRGDRIEKVSVMGYQKEGALVPFEPIFQPDHCVEVKVIGRFVQQQEVGTAHQCLCQVQAHAPAP